MKANKELINLLRRSAQYLQDNPEKYYWAKTNTCNCGIVAQVALGLTEQTTKRFGIGTWEDIIDLYKADEKEAKNNLFCEQTGLTYFEVIESLLSFGFDLEDFVRLEYLDQDYMDLYTEIEYNCTDIKCVTEWLYKEANKLELEILDKEVLSTRSLSTLERIVKVKV
jgi:hypothetical protein